MLSRIKEVLQPPVKVDLETRLVSEVTSQQVLEATKRVLFCAVSPVQAESLNRGQIRCFTDLINICGHLSHANCESDNPIVDRVVQLSSLMLCHIVCNPMAKMGSDGKVLHYTYQRSQQIRVNKGVSLLPLYKHEIHQFLKDKNHDVRTIDQINIGDPDKVPDRFCLSHSVTLDVFHKMIELWISNMDTRIKFWQVPLIINQDFGFMSFFRQNTYQEAVEVNSPLPIHDLLGAMLRIGIPFGAGSLRQVDPETPRSSLKIDQHHIKSLLDSIESRFTELLDPKTGASFRKALHLRPENAPLRERQLIEHHRFTFSSEPIGKNEHFLLGRSGVSINELALRLVGVDYRESYQGYMPLAFEMPGGWYYENSLWDSRHNWLTNSLDEAKILLIAHEPNVPYRGDYISDRDKAVARLVDSARNDPFNKYYLVYDQTCDPLHEIYIDQNLNNLIVIQTISLTKHQRGVGNVFGGYLRARGLSSSTVEIEKQKIKSFANISPAHIYGLSKQTTAAYRKRQAQLHETIQSIASKFKAPFSNLGIDFQPYSYYFFLNLSDELSKKVNPNKSIHEIVKRYINAGIFSSIRVGDSFNLPPQIPDRKVAWG